MSQTFRFAVAATFGLAMAGSAMAADLPLRSPPPVYAPPPPVFTWTGFYLGVNGGYDFDHHSRYLTGTSNGLVALGSAVPTPFRQADAGFTAGGQIGYNYQIGGLGGLGGGYFGLGAASIVVGVEADIAYTDIDKTASFTGANPYAAGGFGTTKFRSQMDFLGTARGRIGLAFNQFMVYGTGGFAYGDVTNTATFSLPNVPLTSTGRADGIQTGYAVGGGIEYALPTGSFLNFFKASAVTIKGEYLYYDLGGREFTYGDGLTFSRVKTNGELARLGINYKF